MTDRARDTALSVLRRVFTQGAFASAAMRAAMSDAPDLSGRDRAFITELVYGVVRRRPQLDRALSSKGKRLKDLDPKLHDVLRLGAYQLAFMDRVPEHAAVDAAVEQAKARLGKRGAGQANAILRRLAERPREARIPAPVSAKQDPVQHLAHAAALPRPVAALLVEDLGFDRALAFGLASLERAPLTLRANLLVVGRDALMAEVEGSPGHHPLSVVLPERLGALPADLEAVAEGRATVQDEASMRVVDLLDPQPGESVLDLCSSPGGKTTHMAERMQDRGRVVACDRNAHKLARVGASAERLGLRSVELSDPPPPAEPVFDRVLVDAPCSGLGTLRRHPEIKLRLQPEDLQRMTALQAKLLGRAAQRTRPGGVLVYSVCSVLAREGRQIVEGLSGFSLEEELLTHPGEAGQPDGFYAARFVREQS